MNKNKYNLWITILVMSFFVLPAGSKQNNPPTSMESRLLVLEKKVADLEQRLNLLESTELSDSDLSDETDDIDPNDNETDCSKAEKRIKDAQDSIVLVRKQISALEVIETNNTEDELEVCSKICKLTIKLERDYVKVIRSAGKCPTPGVDIMEMKKELVECKVSKRETRMKMRYLQDKLQKEAIKESAKKSSKRPVRRESTTTTAPHHKINKGTIVQ